MLHGLTSTPASVESLSSAFRAAGYAVSSPLLPGHGTSVDDLERAGWEDWVSAATAACAELAAACERVVVAGLSMGGSLACRLAADHRDVVAGVVAVNPFIDPPAESFRAALRAMLADGIWRAPGIGGDAADPSVEEAAYDCPWPPCSRCAPASTTC